MADHIDRSDVNALPVRNYQSIRPQIKSGDILFGSGNYIVAKLIGQVTSSPWSHCGIILRMEEVDRILLLESVEDAGVRFAPLSKYLIDYSDGRPYNGRIVIARCAGVDDTFVEKLAGFGMDELTRPYDNEEIGMIVARIALGLGKKKRDRSYICSELVYECFFNAGREFVYDEDGYVAPEDIWVDSDISLKWRLL